MNNTRLTLDTVCEFTWNFGSLFLLEPKIMNISGSHFVWSDPDYGGDNTIKPYHGNPRDFTEPGFSGRFKGTHTIRKYCGEDVAFIL
jgi:hypothetical protein